MATVETHIDIDGLACAVTTVEEQGMLGEGAYPDHPAMRAAPTMTVALIEHG
jgi:hypothetical protein